jgi:hypothetical protein
MAAGCTPLTPENVVGIWYVRYPEDGSEETVLLRPGGALEQTCILECDVLYRNEGTWEITDEGLVFRHYMRRWAGFGVGRVLQDTFRVNWLGDGHNIMTDVDPEHNLQKVQAYGQSAKP